MRQADLDYILTTMLESHTDVSDLNITVNRPLQVEASGELLKVSLKPSLGSLTSYQTEVLAICIINSDRRLTETLLREGSCDTSYSVPGKARLRINIFSQRASFSIVMRKLTARIATIEELELPPIFNDVAMEKNGLVLVTGATGSGKSTSLAAMLDAINREQAVHVITLEDPVEFMHRHNKSTFNQRELGQDFDTFAHGLRAALRQAPKVILVGEIRDRETIEIGLSASETGHLVMSTLHTVNAGQTINRIIGMFDKDEETLIRTRLADTLRWSICQRLLPREDDGRIAVFEIMGSNLRVKDSILNGEREGKTFYEIIKASEGFGWRTFDTSIIKAFEQKLISEDTAMAYASHKAVVGQGMDRIKAGRGQETSNISGLGLDEKYDDEKIPRRKIKRRQ